MKNPSLSPDELEFDPIEEQKKRRGKKASNKKKNEILKEKGLHKDLSSSTLEIFGSEYFFNYELSWLKFNERVLFEAWNEKNKLLERLKFIGIVCSNLDEFFQKRVGGLKRQLGAGVKKLSIDGMSASDQLTAIRHEVQKMIESYRSCFFDHLIP
jgi:polyphosphate kinase